MSWPREGHINLMQALTALRKAIDLRGKETAALKKEVADLKKGLAAAMKQIAKLGGQAPTKRAPAKKPKAGD